MQGVASIYHDIYHDNVVGARWPGLGILGTANPLGFSHREFCRGDTQWS